MPARHPHSLPEREGSGQGAVPTLDPHLATTPTIFDGSSPAPNPHSRSLLMALGSLLNNRQDVDSDATELLRTPDHIPTDFSDGRRPVGRPSGDMSYSLATESTLAPGDADYDFATTLQDVVNKYVQFVELTPLLCSRETRQDRSVGHQAQGAWCPI